MKKGLCLLLLLMATTTLYAQLVRRDTQQSQVGLRAGVNFSTINDGLNKLEGIEDEPWMPRLTVGLATSFWMNRAFAFAPEVNYSQRGYEAKGNSLLGNYEYAYRYDFAEIPLLFRYTVGRELIRGYINLGPTISYMLQGKEIAKMGGVSTTKKIDMEDERYTAFELGAAVGGGLHINSGIGSFMIDLRYHHGFTDLQNDGFSLPAYTTGGAPEQYRTQYVSASLIFLAPYRD